MLLHQLIPAHCIFFRPRFRLYQSGASAQATEHVEDRHVVV